MIEDLGGKAIIVKGDMTKQDEIENVVTECREAFGEEIHILVNIAGGLVGRKSRPSDQGQRVSVSP